MDIFPLAIPDVRLIKPRRFADDRGWFSETFREDLLREAGITEAFVQDNQSFSRQSGTVRGLHFQTDPFAQAKLVRAVSGSILDVAVDIRPNSPSFGQHVAAKLTAEGGEQLYIPAGFAHGFCTLEPDTMIIYKVTAYYSCEHDRSLKWNDPVLEIDWPVSEGNAVLSDKDRVAPPLSEIRAALA